MTVSLYFFFAHSPHSSFWRRVAIYWHNQELHVSCHMEGGLVLNAVGVLIAAVLETDTSDGFFKDFLHICVKAYMEVV